LFECQANKCHRSAWSRPGGGKVANISRDDLGRAAACVLAGSYTGKDIFTLSGP
jgi:hypothetical protein